MRFTIDFFFEMNEYVNAERPPSLCSEVVIMTMTMTVIAAVVVVVVVVVE
jgi:hypothetical protein